MDFEGILTSKLNPGTCICTIKIHLKTLLISFLVFFFNETQHKGNKIKINNFSFLFVFYTGEIF